MMRHAPDLVAAHPEIPWATMYRMRNQLAHAYHLVDIGVVWLTATVDIPTLEHAICRLIGDINNDAPP